MPSYAWLGCQDSSTLVCIQCCGFWAWSMTLCCKDLTTPWNFFLLTRAYSFSSLALRSLLFSVNLSCPLFPFLYFHYSCLCLPWLHLWLLRWSLTDIATVTAITAQDAALAYPLLVGSGSCCRGRCPGGSCDCTKASGREALPLSCHCSRPLCSFCNSVLPAAPLLCLFFSSQSTSCFAVSVAQSAA